MEGYGLSQRRACRLLSIGPSTLRYQRRRAGDETVRQRRRELAAQRRRFGYRRLGWLLVREEHALNHKKVYRLCREERLMVRRAAGASGPSAHAHRCWFPAASNQRWSLDFVSDTLADGRRFRVLCILDDFSCECLAAVVDTSPDGVRVMRALEQAINQRGWPHTIVSDNGTELTSNAVLRLAAERVAWRYIQPGKPIQERFHRKFQQQTARRVPQ